jgi:ATP-dependent DNA ligase
MTPAHLCQLLTEWNRTLPGWAVGSQKLDGWRCLWLRDRSGKPGLYSRNGIPLSGLEHVEHELRAWEKHAGQRMFFDGEIVVGDGPDTLASTKHWLEAGHKLGGTAGVFHCFDGFAYDDWFRGGTATPLYERKQAIEAIAAAVDADEDHRWQWRPGARGDEPNPVRVVPHQDLWTVDDALMMVAEMWKANLEGIVIKDAESPYVRQRSNAWAKVGRPWQSKIHWQQAA